MQKRQLRLSKNFLGKELVEQIKKTLEKYGKNVKAIILYGSIVYSPSSAHDIDVLIVVDKIRDVNEKTRLEYILKSHLRKKSILPIDVTVFDTKILEENLVPGTFLSGLVLGYDILYDEINFEEIINELFIKIAQLDDYIYIKNRKKWNLSNIAKARIKYRQTIKT